MVVLCVSALVWGWGRPTRVTFVFRVQLEFKGEKKQRLRSITELKHTWVALKDSRNEFLGLGRDSDSPRGAKGQGHNA